MKTLNTFFRLPRELLLDVSSIALWTGACTCDQTEKNCNSLARNNFRQGCSWIGIIQQPDYGSRSGSHPVQNRLWRSITNKNIRSKCSTNQTWWPVSLLLSTCDSCSPHLHIVWQKVQQVSFMAKNSSDNTRLSIWFLLGHEGRASYLFWWLSSSSVSMKSNFGTFAELLRWNFRSSESLSSISDCNNIAGNISRSQIIISCLKRNSLYTSEWARSRTSWRRKHRRIATDVNSSWDYFQGNVLHRIILQSRFFVFTFHRLVSCNCQMFWWLDRNTNVVFEFYLPNVECVGIWICIQRTWNMISLQNCRKAKCICVVWLLQP